MKPPLLFLSHRIPFPPNKGDKIRSFHLLKHLSARFRIFLGAFIDDPEDWDRAGELDNWCEATRFLSLNPRRARIRSLRGLLDRRPLTLPYYRDAAMARWVERMVSEHGIERALVYSSAMAQYLTGPGFGTMRRFIDFVDVDSDKWRQYAEKKRWPMNRVYRREAARLLEYERAVAERFDAGFFVSREEAELFLQLTGGGLQRVTFYRNGVDIDYFSDRRDYPDPFTGQGPALVFTGAMDYWPNEDAVTWFASDIFPRIRERWPAIEFHIVGGRPTERVRALSAIAGVKVAGRVPDVRPYLAHARAVVVPIRVARGIQNKVLEAMAMAKPVVVTAMGLEGIGARDGTEVLVADDAEAFSDRLDRVLSGAVEAMGARAREKVVREFSWEQTLPAVDGWIR